MYLIFPKAFTEIVQYYGDKAFTEICNTMMIKAFTEIVQFSGGNTFTEFV